MGAIDVIWVVVMGGAEVLRDWAGRELTTQEEPAGTGGLICCTVLTLCTPSGLLLGGSLGGLVSGNPKSFWWGAVGGFACQLWGICKFAWHGDAQWNHI